MYIKTKIFCLGIRLRYRPLLRLPSPQLSVLRTMSAASVGIPTAPPTARAFVPPAISPPQIRKEFPETWIFQDNIT